MSHRMITTVTDELHFRCKADAEELGLNLSTYMSMLLRQRHGLLTITLPPPVVTKLPMQAKQWEDPFA
jgi:hypothetical protein